MTGYKAIIELDMEASSDEEAYSIAMSAAALLRTMEDSSGTCVVDINEITEEDPP